MALSVTHTFVSGVADGGDASLVQPSNWNATHTLTAALNKVLGTDGASTTIQELSCTAAGRAILAAADATAQRTALGLATVASSASAADLSTGILLAARMPALTGDVTSSAGAVATTIANAAVTHVKAANGFLTNYASATSTVQTTFSGVTPVDNTIPQITEGSQVISLSFTPTDATSKVRLRFNCFVSVGTATHIVAALHRAGTADALQVTCIKAAEGDSFYGMSLEYVDSPASGSAQTYSVRIGNATANNMRINGGTSVGNFFGGSASATLTVEQIKA
jgi:hypothetical protein